MIAQHTYRELHRQLVIALEPQNVLDVGCGDGALRITRLQKEGSKRLTAAEFLAGAPLPAGTQLG